MKQTLNRALGLALLLAAASHTADGQTVLRLPVSTRALGMGNMAVAGRDEDVLFYNPAQLVIARGTSGAMGRVSSTTANGSLASVIRFNTGGIGIGMSMAHFDAFDQRTDLLRNQITAPGAAAGTSLVAAAGFAQVFKSVRYGIAGKYTEDNVGGVQDSRGLIDVGLSRDFFRFYTLGLAVQNIAWNQPPLTRPRYTLGAATSRGVGLYDLTATAGLVVDHYLQKTHWAPAGGAELGWSWIDGYNVVVRAGARSPLAGEGTFTGGAGVNADRVSVDYAIESLSGSRVGHRFGIRIR